jgi:hypothetical protein
LNTVQPPKVRSVKEQIKDIFARYRGERSDLIPILQDLQEALGYIPAEAMKETAAFLGVPESVVYGVVSFYAQFYLMRQGRRGLPPITRSPPSINCRASSVAWEAERARRERRCWFHARCIPERVDY